MNTTPTFDELGVLCLQNNFQKEELPMCNPTDKLVRYPLPYKVVDGCLCQETTKRNKPMTEKLCNFTACIVNEVLFDDGVGTSRTMRIGGVHASGRKLPEIEVTANEFKKMDLADDRHGILFGFYVCK